MKLGVRAFVGLSLGACVVAAGCSSLSPATNKSGDATMRYEAAVRDAAIVSPAKALPLTQLPGSGTVRTVRWVAENRLTCPDSSLPCDLPKVGGYVYWVSLEAELTATCRAWHLSGASLTRRLEQLLGLPPDPPALYRKTRFLVIEVDVTNLRRPCLGLEAQGAGPPVCTPRASTKSGSGAVTDPGFVGAQMADSYVLGDRQPGYPFTRLGYTYDWSGESEGHYGVSEFLLAPHTAAKVVAQPTTDELCATSR